MEYDIDVFFNSSKDNAIKYTNKIDGISIEIAGCEFEYQYYEEIGELDGTDWCLTYRGEIGDGTDVEMNVDKVSNFFLKEAKKFQVTIEEIRFREEMSEGYELWPNCEL